MEFSIIDYDGPPPSFDTGNLIDESLNGISSFLGRQWCTFTAKAKKMTHTATDKMLVQAGIPLIPEKVDKQRETIAKLELAKANYLQEYKTVSSQSEILERDKTQLYNRIASWTTVYLSLSTLKYFSSCSQEQYLACLEKLKEEQDTINVKPHLLNALIPPPRPASTRVEIAKKSLYKIKAYLIVYLFYPVIKVVVEWVSSVLTSTMKSYFDKNGLPVEYLINCINELLDKVNEQTTKTEQETNLISAIKKALLPEDTSKSHAENHKKIIKFFNENSTSYLAKKLVQLFEKINSREGNTKEINLFTEILNFVKNSLTIDPIDATGNAESFEAAGPILVGCRSMLLTVLGKIAELKTEPDEQKDIIYQKQNIDELNSSVSKFLKEVELEKALALKVDSTEKTIKQLLGAMHAIITLEANPEKISNSNSKKDVWTSIFLLICGKNPENMSGTYDLLAKESAPDLARMIVMIANKNENAQGHQDLRVQILQQILGALSKPSEQKQKVDVEADINKLAHVTIHTLLQKVQESNKTPTNKTVVAFDEAIRALQLLVSQTDEDCTQDIDNESLKRLTSAIKNVETKKTQINLLKVKLSITPDQNKTELDTCTELVSKIDNYLANLPVTIAKKRLAYVLASVNAQNYQQAQKISEVQGLVKFIGQNEAVLLAGFDPESEYTDPPLNYNGNEDILVIRTGIEGTIRDLKNPLGIANPIRSLTSIEEFLHRFHNPNTFQEANRLLQDELEAMMVKERSVLPPKNIVQTDLLPLIGEMKAGNIERFASSKIADLIALFQLDFLPEGLLYGLFNGE